MVVFVDLDEGQFLGGGGGAPQHNEGYWSMEEVHEKSEYVEPAKAPRPNPNINAMTEALGCYPYVLAPLS